MHGDIKFMHAIHRAVKFFESLNSIVVNCYIDCLGYKFNTNGWVEIFGVHR